MNILIFGKTALYHRALWEGHRAKEVEGRYVTSDGKILRRKLDRLFEHDSYDCALAVQPDCGADDLRSRGLPVFGGGLFSRTLEASQSYNRELQTLTKLPKIDSNHVEGFLWNGETADHHFQALSYRRVLDKDLGALDTCCACKLSLVDEPDGLETLYQLLKKTSYRGMVYYDITGIHCSFVPEYLFALLELFRSKSIQLLYQTACGGGVSAGRGYRVSVAVGISIYPHIVIPPAGTEIGGITDKALKHVWPEGLERNEDKWLTNGKSSKLVIVTAAGENHREASRRVYRAIKRLKIPFPMYRTDII